MSKPFQFKEFSINQDRCAMKIGTDAVILGAWTSINHNPNTILDIGAGTGVLSLMLAQRSNAEAIEAIEIDAQAFEQCSENFENSQWADRLFCYHASLLEFVEEVDDKFDLIICNPPFYTEDYKTNSASRDLARFNDSMPFEHLIYAAAHLLSDEGIFSVVIPIKEEEHFVALASKIGLFLNRSLHARGNTESEIKRSLLEFSFHDNQLKTSELVIETARHQYTDEYINLTKEFYLKM